MRAKDNAPRCPYCGNGARLVTGTVIYPHRPDLAPKNFYLCAACDAYCGCHPNTTTPLGRLANAQLRAAKQRAHSAFDPVWKSGDMRRSAAYAWLAEQLAIPARECHIGMFDVDQCAAVIDACRRLQK